jgi:hypothetical protein
MATAEAEVANWPRSTNASRTTSRTEAFSSSSAFVKQDEDDA